MTQEAREMLERVYEVFDSRFTEPVEAWDHFLEFIAADNDCTLFTQFGDQLEWLINDGKLVNKILDVYKPIALRAEYYDHLGEMYLEKVLHKSGVGESRTIVPWEDAKRIVSLSIPETKERVTVIDGDVSTGRLLMAAHERAPNAYLFGSDSDIRAVRIAYTNFAIHGIKGYLLHADADKHDLSVQTESGRHNWGYSNRWYSCMEKLRPIEKTREVVN